ncbi:MAG: hypothetical protein ACREUI_11240, partial [Burkholderiales bacterium]
LMQQARQSGLARGPARKPFAIKLIALYARLMGDGGCFHSRKVALHRFRCDFSLTPAESSFFDFSART